MGALPWEGLSSAVLSVLVAAAVVREGPGRKVLLTQRPGGTHLAGRWEFPGGKVETDEDPRAAVVRECAEEAGIDIEVVDILDECFHRFEARSVILLFYDCRWVGGSVQHLGVQAHAWVEPHRLEGYHLPPPDQRLVRKLQRGL